MFSLLRQNRGRTDIFYSIKNKIRQNEMHPIVRILGFEVFRHLSAKIKDIGIAFEKITTRYLALLGIKWCRFFAKKTSLKLNKQITLE